MQTPHFVRERLSSPDAPEIAKSIYNDVEHAITRWWHTRPHHRDYAYKEFAQKFKCSIPTVQRATAWLRKVGWLYIEQTGRGGRYHLYPPVATVVSTPPSGAMYNPVHSLRDITSDLPGKSPVIPLEAAANPDNSVPDSVSETQSPPRKELRNNISLGGGVAPGPSRARGATPTPPEASITSQELDELFSNVGAGEAAAPLGGAAPTRVTARMDDDITDAIVGTVASENQEPPKREKATDTEPEHPTDTGETFIEWITGKATGPNDNELSDEELARAERIEAGYRKFQAQARDAGGEFADMPDNYGRDTLGKRGKARAFAEQRRRRMKHAPVHERQLEQH